LRNATNVPVDFFLECKHEPLAQHDAQLYGVDGACCRVVFKNFGDDEKVGPLFFRFSGAGGVQNIVENERMQVEALADFLD
jgi:hypothetical protein